MANRVQNTSLCEFLSWKIGRKGKTLTYWSRDAPTGLTFDSQQIADEI